MKVRNRILLSGAIYMWAMVPGIAVSQSDGLSDIIVTAQKRDQSLIDVPATVNVFTGDTLEELKIFDVRELSALSPGLSLQNFTGGEATVTLRGVPFNPTTGAPDAVDIYLNEATVQTDTAFEALYDVSQMEVLRGPQGSLRGRTSPAGAITIATRKPNLEKAEGYVQGSISDNHLYNVQGGVSMPIVADKLGIRIAGLLDRNRLDQVYNVNTGEYNRRWVESVRGTVAWKPAENLTITAMYQFINSKRRISRQGVGEGSPLTGNMLLIPEDRIGVAERAPLYKRKSHMAMLLADLDLDNIAIKYIGSYQSNPAHNLEDQDAGNAVPDYFNIQQVRVPPKLLSQEIRVQSQGDGFWNWMVGAYYERIRANTLVSQRSDTFFPPLTAPVFSIGVDVAVPSKSDKLAFFMMNRFAFTDKLTLEVGIRYNRFILERQSTLTLDIPGVSVPPIDTITPENARVKKTPITGNASLSYEFSPNATGYVSYGRSFRPGNPTAGLTVALGQDLLLTGSETSNQVEIGLKGRTSDGKLSVNVAAYYQKFNGFISGTTAIFYRDPVTGATDDTFPFNFNGDAIVKGVEVQADLRPSRNLSLGINASYAKGRFDNARAPCNDFNQDGVPDAIGAPVVTPGEDVSRCTINGRVAEEPDFTLALLPSFRHPVGSLEAFVNGVFNLRPAFTSETVAGYRYPSQESLNLFAGLRSQNGAWELTIWGKNLFNQTRIVNIRDSNFVQGPFNSGYRLTAVTTPREFGLTGKINF